MSNVPLPPVVAAALAAVMHDADVHDVGLTLQAPARPREGVLGPPGSSDGRDDQPADLWVWDGASGTGFFLDPDEADADAAERVADVVHDACLDALWGQGRDTAWPPCPAHPGTHPLVVALGNPEPTWACPTSGAVVCAVGVLG